MHRESVPSGNDDQTAYEYSSGKERLHMENKNKSALTEKQKVFLEENFRVMKEKELFQKLSELGPETDEKTFVDAIRALSSKIEKEVFSRDVSEEELAAASGGDKEIPCGIGVTVCSNNANYSCIYHFFRNIYEGGFPNCAATVEDGSWCIDNDACYGSEVCYTEMKDCSKAWK